MTFADIEDIVLMDPDIVDLKDRLETTVVLHTSNRMESIWDHLVNICYNAHPSIDDSEYIIKGFKYALLALNLIYLFYGKYKNNFPVKFLGATRENNGFEQIHQAVALGVMVVNIVIRRGEAFTIRLLKYNESWKRICETIETVSDLPVKVSTSWVNEIPLIIKEFSPKAIKRLLEAL